MIQQQPSEGIVQHLGTGTDLAVFREKAMAGYVSTIYFDGR